jgi:hypothetical protein
MTTRASLTKTSIATGTAGSLAHSTGLFCLILAPAVLAFLILYGQRLPFPYQDDYKALLAFVTQYVHASGLTARSLQIAVFEYNNYRLIFEHSVVAAQVELTHRVNFALLTALGDCFLLGIFVLLWCSFGRKPTRNNLLHFFPVSLLFFSLSYWETLNWAEASLQNVPVIFFALAALYFLSPQSSAIVRYGRFFLACIAALLSCCSSPNGFMLAPVGLLMLISLSRYRRAVLWCLIFVLPLSAYLCHPTKHAERYHFHLRQVFYFFAFLGGAFPLRFIAFTVGVTVLAVVVWAVRSGFVRKNPVLAFLSLWIVFTAGPVAAIRESVSSRYSMYSLLMLICCYVFLLDRFEAAPLGFEQRPLVRAVQQYFFEIVVICSLCFYIQMSFRAYRELHKRREMVIAGLKFYLENPQANSPQMDPLVDKLFPDEKLFELYMLNRAKAERIYTVPPENEIQRY